MSLIHGTCQGYRKGCSCTACRDAWRDHARELRSRTLLDGDPRHGTYVGYDYFSCRCLKCTEAKRIHRQSEAS